MTTDKPLLREQFAGGGCLLLALAGCGGAAFLFASVVKIIIDAAWG